MTSSNPHGAAIGGRVARYVARAFVGHFVVLVAAATLVRLAIAPALAGLSLQPSAWVALGPIAVVAAAWTARRFDRSGEALAIDVGGTSRAGSARLSVLIAVLAQVGLAGPGTRTESGLARSAVAQALVATSGDLLIASGPSAFIWRVGEAVPESAGLGPAGDLHLPAGFVPAPRDPTLLRRQLFVVGTPLMPTDHPFDPTLARWVWLAASALGVGIVLGAERGRRRWLAGVVLAAAAAAI